MLFVHIYCHLLEKCERANAIKAASSDDRARARAHVGVGDGRRATHIAQRTAQLTGKCSQAVRILCITRHHHQGFWEFLGDATEPFSGGHT